MRTSRLILLLVLCTFACIATLQVARCESAEPTTTTSDSELPPSIPAAPASADSAAPTIPSPAATRPPQPQQKKIELNQADFCRACYSVVEEFHKWTVRNFQDPNKRVNTTMSRHELVEWFCRTGPFAQWKEQIKYGCIKTIQDHYEPVLSPFIGTHLSHEFTTLAKIFQHKVEACHKIDACDEWKPETRPKTECEACDRLVGDIHWSLERELKINQTIVENTLKTICMVVGMRHERPMEIEALCHEHVDENWKDLQKSLVSVYNDPLIPAYQKRGEVKKRFCGGMAEVCEPERKQIQEETKRRKEEEKKTRLEKRKEKKASGSESANKKDEL